MYRVLILHPSIGQCDNPTSTDKMRIRISIVGCIAWLVKRGDGSEENSKDPQVLICMTDPGTDQHVKSKTKIFARAHLRPPTYMMNVNPPSNCRKHWNNSK